MDPQRLGSFRQRSRKSERATLDRRRSLQRRRAQRTYADMEEFDYTLKARETSLLNVDDLPPEAEATMLSSIPNALSRLTSTRRSMEGTASLDDSSGDEGLKESRIYGSRRLQELGRSSSAPGFPSVRSHGDDRDLCERRPPSPTGIYDYGCISQRPRSSLGQHRLRHGREGRPPGHARASPGFYSPGSHFKQGSYGTSLLEPVFLPTNAPQLPQEVPRRYRQPSDVRPATVGAMPGECHDYRRSRKAGPSESVDVRTTKTHAGRAARSFQTLDQSRDDAHLEQVTFERGLLDGNWEDPRRDCSGGVPEEVPRVYVDWIPNAAAGLSEGVSTPQRNILKILFGLESAIRNSKSTLRHIFAVEDVDKTSVMSLESFQRGLVRLGVLAKEELTERDVAEALTAIDPGFDGQVTLQLLPRAIASVQGVQLEQSRASRRREQQVKAQIAKGYGMGDLNVEAVHVDRNPRSLFNFETAFAKFQSQQRDLLAHHGEIRES